MSVILVSVYDSQDTQNYGNNKGKTPGIDRDCVKGQCVEKVIKAKFKERRNFSTEIYSKSYEREEPHSEKNAGLDHIFEIKALFQV